MTIDKHFFKKVIIWFYRTFKTSNYVKVMSGHLKNYKWNVNTHHNYIIGNYEEIVTDYIIANVNSEKTFYDLGANVGYYSILAAKYGMTAIAFEPDLTNMDRLQKHLEINKVKNVKLFPYAICEKKQMLKFSVSENLAANTYKDSKYLSTEKYREVQGISIDEFVIENPDIKPMSILKIDVEGAELDVLKGAVNSIIKYKPDILLSTHDIHIPNISNDCVAFLESINYKVEKFGEFIDDEDWQDFLATPLNKVV